MCHCSVAGKPILLQSFTDPGSSNLSVSSSMVLPEPRGKGVVHMLNLRLSIVSDLILITYQLWVQCYSP